MKQCKNNIATPIYLLWIKSLETGLIPRDCKKSLIVPLHKKGKKDLPENFLPISLTSHLIKIFERIIKWNITLYLEENNLLGNFQHGFRRKRSCLTQLISHYTHISDQTNSGKIVDVIYLDFARAFDKVDHNILLSKIKKLNIDGPLLYWIKSFLQNRTQIVTVNEFNLQKLKLFLVCHRVLYWPQYCLS